MEAGLVYSPEDLSDRRKTVLTVKTLWDIWTLIFLICPRNRTPFVSRQLHLFSALGGFSYPNYLLKEENVFLLSRYILLKASSSFFFKKKVSLFYRQISLFKYFY